MFEFLKNIGGIFTFGLRFAILLGAIPLAAGILLLTVGGGGIADGVAVGLLFVLGIPVLFLFGGVAGLKKGTRRTLLGNPQVRQVCKLIVEPSLAAAGKGGLKHEALDRFRENLIRRRDSLLADKELPDGERRGLMSRMRRRLSMMFRRRLSDAVDRLHKQVADVDLSDKGYDESVEILTDRLHGTVDYLLGGSIDQLYRKPLILTGLAVLVVLFFVVLALFF